MHYQVFSEVRSFLFYSWLSRNNLNWSDKLRYLGIFIINKSKDLFDLNVQVGKFYATIHSAISNFNLNKVLVALEILKGKCISTPFML